MNNIRIDALRVLLAAVPVYVAGMLLSLSVAHAAPEAVFIKEVATRPSAGTLWTFWIIGALTVLGAVVTITRRNPVSAAVSLVGTLFCSAGLYLLLHATFMAAIQVLVYAGAIMVLFVFVIMAVKDPEQESGLSKGLVTKLVGVVAILLLFVRAASVLMGAEVRQPRPVPAEFGQAASVGKMLFGMSGRCKVPFRYEVPAAERNSEAGKLVKVELVGDFRAWKSGIPMRPHEGGWRTEVTLPHKTRVMYSYLLSRQKPDPANPKKFRIDKSVSGQRMAKDVKCSILNPNYLLPFEAISILLLTAIVGAVVVSRRKRRQDR